MLCAFSPNLGMGTHNMLYIQPPSIMTDDVAGFAFYDRIFVDGQSLDFMSGANETKFFNALIDAGVVEARGDLYDETDLRRCQAIYAAVFNAEHSKLYRGKMVDFADEKPYDFEHKLLNFGDRPYIAYVLQLRVYCAMTASAKLRCPAIGKSRRADVDLEIRKAIIAYSQPDDPARDAVLHDPLAGSAEALQALLDGEPKDFPLSVDGAGERAQPMSAINQEVFPDEDCVDTIESGRRLDAFLRFRRAPCFGAVQAFLLRHGAEQRPNAHDWVGDFRRRWAEIAEEPLHLRTMQ